LNKLKHIYDAYIKKYLDKIVIRKLNTFPKMKKQIHAWLKAKIMHNTKEN